MLTTSFKLLGVENALLLLLRIRRNLLCMLWWLTESLKMEMISMSNAKIAMVKILRNQEIFTMPSQVVR